jgi:hypothetical protein
MVEVEYEVDGTYQSIEPPAEDISFDDESGHWIIQTKEGTEYIPRERVYKVTIGDEEVKDGDDSSGSGVTLV